MAKPRPIRSWPVRIMIMEVFIGFTKDDDFTLLQQTLERWDACANVNLAAIQCDVKKFEIARRVAADNMAKCNHYILADLGCVLDSWNALEGIEERLAGMGETLIGLAEVFSAKDAKDAEKSQKPKAIGLPASGSAGRARWRSGCRNKRRRMTRSMCSR